MSEHLQYKAGRWSSMGRWSGAGGPAAADNRATAHALHAQGRIAGHCHTAGATHEIVRELHGARESVQLQALVSRFPPGTLLPGMGMGLCSSPSGQPLAAEGGERYSLQVDVEGKGSMDASASCRVPGKLLASALLDDSVAGSSVQYIAVLYHVDMDAAPGAVYSGSERSFEPEPALTPGAYRGTLQSLAASADFAAVSIQGQLLCGTSAAVEVSFNIR